MEQIEGVVQAVNRQYFTDACIMVKYLLSAISRRVEVPDSHVGHTYEGRIAENHQRLLRPGEEVSPENAKSDGHIRAIAGQPSFRGFARQKAVRGDGHDGCEEDGQHDYCGEPRTGSPPLNRHNFRGVMG